MIIEVTWRGPEGERVERVVDVPMADLPGVGYRNLTTGEVIVDRTKVPE